MKTISVVLAVVFLISGMAFAGQKVKICVATNEKSPAGAVSKQAGLAPYLLFFDARGKMTDAIENPFKDKEGAGRSVAQLLGSKGVAVVVAEEFRGPIIEVMKAKDIRTVSFKGRALEAVKQVLQSK